MFEMIQHAALPGEGLLTVRAESGYSPDLALRQTNVLTFVAPGFWGLFEWNR